MGRTAIVTGGASGIGRALGAALAARGDDVVLTDRDEELLAQVVRELRDEVPGTVTSAVVDVRDAQAVHDLVHRTHEQAGHLDYLFNNAGIGAGGEAEEIDLSVWDRVIDVNLRGVVAGVAAAYPLMVAQGHGHIVNTASLAGLVPAPLMAPYAATKWGVVGLSLSLRAEAAAHGVRVSAICPGVIDTPIMEKHGPDDLPTPPSLAATDIRAALSRMVGRVYPPTALAEDVLHDLDRDRALIIAPRPARILWRLQRAVPWLVDRVQVRNVARERRLRAQTVGKATEHEVKAHRR